MGKKYSINSAGYIVAERDIYSLGGFIPRGSVGGKVASEKQLSQGGECWLASGNISGRQDVRIKDNAYVGTFPPGAEAVHTDGITEFSGNTLIPGNIWVRSLATETKNNVFIKDSFIGVSMDVFCGPSTTTTAFPFEQGTFKAGAAKGTLFTSASMRSDDTSACRSTATLRLGPNTYLYIPTGYRARVFWAYYDNSNQLAYSGESTTDLSGLIKLNHLVYKLAMVSIAKNDGTAMTPTQLGTSGAKILGHISGSLLMDLRPESASGQYVIVNSSLIATSGNFSLSTTQRRFLAGGLYNTNMYTDRAEMKPYGSFRNVGRIDYDKYLGDTYRAMAARDRFISAYDCPLLRVDKNTYSTSLAAKGSLVLRRCIVPKAAFTSNIFNGDVYEDIDFSYAQEHLGKTFIGNTLASSHKQGLYAASLSSRIVGFVSRPENAADGAYIGPDAIDDPLNGSVIEQGAYNDTLIGYYYEDTKADFSNRVRTRVPFSTEGAYLPAMPSGFKIAAACYLDEYFIVADVKTDPTSVSSDYPYFVLVFGKSDNSAITPKDFAALNLRIRSYDYSSVPTISGNGFVGGGCSVRGDVEVIGQSYVNRVLDVNLWERGMMSEALAGLDYEAGKAPAFAGNRYRFVEAFPVESGGTISCAAGYYMYAYWYGEDGLYLSQLGWNQTFTVSGPQKFVGLVLKKADSAAASGGLIEDSDIPLANVKYVRAFKKRRYITNELDRTSPEDIWLGPDYWEQGGISIAEGDAGKPYEELKIASPYHIRLKRPFGLGVGCRVTFLSAYSFGTSYYDAVTKLLYGSTSANMNNALFSLVGSIADSSTAPITPADVTAARVVIEFTPTPRIIAPYGSNNLFTGGPKIRVYDNAVLSGGLDQQGAIVLQGDAVMGNTPKACVCGNGHDDAIIKKP